jgi:hypothetical protein
MISDLDAERMICRYGYVVGHDQLLHCSDAYGFTRCKMGRSLSLYYTCEGPATCLTCLTYLLRLA